MKSSTLQVLYEDNHLLAVLKPAGLPTMGVAEGRPSLLSLAKADIKRRYNKPGNVYLGAMSRLDAPVSGVVLFARTSKAAARLTEQFRERRVEKSYLAIVSGQPPTEQHCVDWIVKDERHRKMHRTSAAQPGAQQAALSFRRLERVQGFWLLEVALDTGRKHQIRVQLSSRGWPIVGDHKYGSREDFPAGIALHSRRLSFTHPTQGTTLQLIAPIPPAWQKFGCRENLPG